MFFTVWHTWPDGYFNLSINSQMPTWGTNVPGERFFDKKTYLEWKVLDKILCIHYLEY